MICKHCGKTKEEHVSRSFNNGNGFTLTLTNFCPIIAETYMCQFEPLENHTHSEQEKGVSNLINSNPVPCETLADKVKDEYICLKDKIDNYFEWLAKYWELKKVWENYNKNLQNSELCSYETLKNHAINKLKEDIKTALKQLKEKEDFEFKELKEQTVFEDYDLEDKSEEWKKGFQRAMLLMKNSLDIFYYHSNKNKKEIFGSLANDE